MPGCKQSHCIKNVQVICFCLGGLQPFQGGGDRKRGRGVGGGGVAGWWRRVHEYLMPKSIPACVLMLSAGPTNLHVHQQGCKLSHKCSRAAEVAGYICLQQPAPTP